MAAALVDTAAKCVPAPASPTAEASHARARCALVVVSIVVKVLEQTITSVVAGFSRPARSTNEAPSMFETKCTLSAGTA